MTITVEPMMHWTLGGVRNILRDLFYMKDILIVLLTPVLLIPFLVVENGGSVSRLTQMSYSFSLLKLKKKKTPKSVLFII